ncbi:MAG: site-specific DNA-methyltransferase [Bacilli bacterium]|nr:site-specific DNA-methyltransferase [Bacilli bacterium]
MISQNNIYFKNNDFSLYKGDSFVLLEEIENKTIDMIFADPPYFLSGDGITCHSGMMVSVKKAEWDEEIDVSEKIEYNRRWIRLCRNLLTEEGTIWISGTFHNIYTIGVALEFEGFTIINNIIWKKLNPPPNISCRAFTHSTETVLWAKKNNSKHYFNYELMKKINRNKQMKDVWEFSLTKPSEKKEGKHPTQKPLDLLQRVILASTEEGDLVLDPFNGSGTTGIACAMLNRKYIGIDNIEKYLEISKKRYLSFIKIND